MSFKNAAAGMPIGGGKKVYISLDSEVTAPGQYALIIMDGSIQKMIDDSFLPELEFSYTIAGEPAPEIITLPEGLTAEYYLFKGLDSSYDEPKEKTSEVEVAIDGQDVYIKGLSISFPVEGWAKGTLEGNTLTIPQTYLGDAEIWGMVFDLSITACTFVYDAEAGTFTSEAGYNITSVEGGDADFFTNVVLTRWGEVVPATPATPEITEFVNNGDYGYYISMSIPATDVDGNNLLTSKLSYQIFYEMDGEQHPFVFTTEKYEMLTENMETIPYNFTDDWDIGKAGWQVYLNDDNVTSWDKVGVKSIYTGGGETRESEMFWYDLTQTVDEDQLVVVPDGVEQQDWTLVGTYNSYTSSGWQAIDINKGVKVAIDGNDFYLQGLAYWFEDAFVKGTLNGTQVTFASGQFVGEDEYGKEYIVGSETGAAVADFFFNYDADTQTLTLGDNIVVESASKNAVQAYGYWDDATFTAGEYVAPEPVVAPENLVTEDYLFTSQELSFDEETEEPVYADYECEIKVGFDGNDVYVQGLCADFYLPEAWVKGEKNGTTVTFTTGQYFGQVYNQYDMFFVGYGESGIEDVVMTYDEATGEFTTDNWIFINGKQNTLYYYTIYTDNKFTKAGEPTAINGISADGQNAVYFDTMGRRTNSEAKGLLIQQVRQADGTLTTRKVVRK